MKYHQTNCRHYVMIDMCR